VDRACAVIEAKTTHRRRLHNRGHAVATMTGVNAALTLRPADIGVGVGRSGQPPHAGA
jgi:magnesium-transporting ATPase (P-type)